MKRMLVVILVFLVIGFVSYWSIRFLFLPKYVASMIVSEEELPEFLPQKVKKKIKEAKKRANPLAETIILESYNNGISIDQLLELIETTDAETAFRFADSLSGMSIRDQDQVFDLANSLLKPKFDVEVLRDEFNKYVTVETINKGIQQYKANRDELRSSPEIIKQIARQILIEKEKQVMTAIERNPESVRGNHH